LATDPQGNVWLVDNGYNRVQKFDINGKYLLQFGGTGSGNGQFQTPVGIAIARSGNLLIADGGNNRVQEFQPNGVYLRQFGSAGSANGQLSEPRGIAISAGNIALVADAGNHRIARWSHADLDPQSGIVSTEVKVDSQLVEPKYAPGCPTENCSISREWTLNAKDYATGKHNVEVIATDGVGRDTGRPLSITTTKDTSGPKVTAINEFFKMPQNWFEQKTYAYSATMSDSGYGVTSFVFKIDGKVVKSTTQTCSNGGCAASISGSINMAGYSGGAHPAEFIATDAGGNTTKISATYNVDPQGNVSSAEAIDTLEAVETTSDKVIVSAEPPEAAPEDVYDTALHQDGSSLYTTGAPAKTTMSDDPVDGFDIDTPDGVLGVDPTNVGSSATSAEIASDVAAVSGNTASSSDTIVRPIFDGVMAFQSLRSSAAPESYSWTIELGPGLDLVSINEHTAEVFYEDGTPAMMIEAELAHDATGKEVPTTLTVDEPDGITFTIHHKAQPFIYPVVAGAGFQVGYETVTVTEPPPPGIDSVHLEAEGYSNLVVGPPETVPLGEMEAGISSTREKRRKFAETICGHKAKIIEGFPGAKLPTASCGNAFTDDDGEWVIWHATMRGAFFYTPGQTVRHGGAIACFAEEVQDSEITDWKIDQAYECHYGPKTSDDNGGVHASGGHYLRAQAHWNLYNRGHCKDECGGQPNPWVLFADEALELHLWPSGAVETTAQN
jgi:NHL repeat